MTVTSYVVKLQNLVSKNKHDPIWNLRAERHRGCQPVSAGTGQGAEAERAQRQLNKLFGTTAVLWRNVGINCQEDVKQTMKFTQEQK